MEGARHFGDCVGVELYEGKCLVPDPYKGIILPPKGLILPPFLCART